MDKIYDIDEARVGINDSYKAGEELLDKIPLPKNTKEAIEKGLEINKGLTEHIAEDILFPNFEEKNKWLDEFNNGETKINLYDNDPDSPNDIFPDMTDASKKTSPIVIDLNGDGVQTTLRKHGQIYFDLDNNGFADWNFNEILKCA